MGRTINWHKKIKLKHKTSFRKQTTPHVAILTKVEWIGNYNICFKEIQQLKYLKKFPL
jgi:hypothetical protein